MFTAKVLYDEARETLRRPRESAGRVLQWPIPQAAIWPLVALSITLSTLVTELSAAMNPPEPGAAVVYIPPFALAGILGIMNVGMAWGIATIGRTFGGVGTFYPTLILMTWQQFVWFAVLLILTLLGSVVPAIAGLLSMAFGIWMIWVLINFASTLHGIQIGRAALVVILASIIAATAMVFMLGFFGVSFGGAVPNG